MRIVVTGATGNVGTSVVQQLVRDTRVESVVAMARRRPDWRPPGVDWVEADLTGGLAPGVLDGAEAVVHLAWAFQPSHRAEVTWNVNVIASATLAYAGHAALMITPATATTITHTASPATMPRVPLAIGEV